MNTYRTGLSQISYRAAVTALSLASLTSIPALAQADLGNLLSILESTADGSWTRVNLNDFSDVWPAEADRPLSNTSFASPSSIIRAWSSFAWDSTRGDLLLFGGGHANYAGNEVYRWVGSTQQWELASLPSQVAQFATVAGPIFLPVDGAQNAPTSIHTYDNNEYLAVADRMIMLGGASFNTGSTPLIQDPIGTFRGTGPYLFDPSRADGTKVGGTTGSAVDPTVEGGQMWQNRDVRDKFVVSTPSGTLNVGNLDGTTAAVVEDGKDVVYFTGSVGGGTDKYLFRYQVTDVANPALDTVSVVGGWVGGPVAYGAAAMDPTSGFYVSLSNTAAQPFVVWDTDAAGGTSNLSHAINLSISGAAAFAGTQISGMDWDPATEAFWIWYGGGDVWKLELPDSGVLTDTWSLTLVTDEDVLAAGARPASDDPISGGIRGKWKYASNLGAFVALDGVTEGDIWLYRPEGWVNPVPEPGTYALILTGLGMVGWSLARRRRT